MLRTLMLAVGLLLGSEALLAQARLSDAVKGFVRVDAPLIALEHVRVIDGTGAPPAEDQTVVIQNGRIRAVGSSASTPAPEGAKALDLSGYTVIPGLVGMHDHLFYPSPHVAGRGVPPVYTELAYSAPRLYLAGGATSLRTTGSIEPYTDLALKKLIDSGLAPGPKIHVTGPYLEGAGSFTPNLHELTGPDDARKNVEYWTEEGVTSFKAYMHVTRAELSAVIEAAHRRRLKVTGHLCSIGFREADWGGQNQHSGSAERPRRAALPPQRGQRDLRCDLRLTRQGRRARLLREGEGQNGNSGLDLIGKELATMGATLDR